MECLFFIADHRFSKAASLTVIHTNLRNSRGSRTFIWIYGLVHLCFYLHKLDHVFSFSTSANVCSSVTCLLQDRCCVLFWRTIRRTSCVVQCGWPAAWTCLATQACWASPAPSWWKVRPTVSESDARVGAAGNSPCCVPVQAWPEGSTALSWFTWKPWVTGAWTRALGPCWGCQVAGLRGARLTLCPIFCRGLKPPRFSSTFIQSVFNSFHTVWENENVWF